MKTAVPHCRRGRSAVVAGVLSFLLSAPLSASAADFLALADPTLDSTTVAGPAGTTVSATIAPSATVTATNANASVAVAGTNAVATFSNLAWNEAVDWMLQSEGAADLPGRFYAKGEAQWFSTNDLADIAGLAEGMKGVEMSAAPSPTGQMVRIQTRLEIPEGAQTSLPTGEDVGEARTGFAVAQLSGDAAPAYYAFNGASWDRLFGAAPAEGATNDLLMVLDTVREEAFYYVDGIALYATNAVGDPVYAIGMKASDAAVVKGVGFANPAGVVAPVVAEYDVPFVADVSGTPYTNSVAAVEALAAADKAAANDVTVTLLADGVAGSVALAEGEQVMVSAGAFDPSGLAFTAVGAPTWKPVSSGAAPTLVWTVAPNDFAVVWHDGDGTELGTTSVVYGTVPVYLGATEPSKDATATTNFTFDGWAASADGPKLDPLPAVTGPTNFYAHFSESAREYTLTVTFTAPAGFAAPETYTNRVANGAAYSYTPPNVPGCTADPAVVEGTMPTEDVTVAVAYTANQYTITWNYKAADGSDTSDTTTVIWGQTPSHADPADYVANNTMHSFLAWDTTPAAYDGTVDAYTATYSSTAAKATVFSVAGNGATTNTVGYYATLAQAVAAATNGCTVALLANVNEAIVNTADKNFTIDLNGWTWSSDSDVLATAAGTITIEATNGGTMSTEAAQCCAVWAKGGDVVINGGTFTSKDNEEATIYVSNAGSVVTINGGTFENTDTRPYRWKTSLHALTLNVKNDLEGQHLVINGGTFIGNDPQLGDDTAGGNTAQSSVAFVSPGYVAIQDGGGNFVVQPGWNVTFDANGGVPAPAPQRVAAGGTATEPATPPAKEYHAFRAWQTNGVDWVFSTPVAADLTLVADWTRTAFTVTWKNGDTVLETDEHVALNASPSYGGDEPTQDPVGVTTYTFDGWTGGDVVSPTAEADLPPVTADAVYTAHFAASGKPVMVISVAGTDTNYWDTVAQAVDKAGAGETVVLLTDAALSSTVEISKSLTIDLNGNNLAATDCRALWIKSGDVRITGTGTVSADGTGLAGSSSVIRVGDSAANATAAALVIDTNVVVSSAACYGVTVFGKNNADGDAATADISLDLYGTVSVTSSGDADAAVSGNGHASLQPVDIVVHDGATVSSANSAAIYFPGRDTLTVDGSTITGLHGIVARAGSVVVNGGSITATGIGAGEALGDSDIVVPYAAVVYDTSANYPWHASGAVATINGGTIASAVEPCVLQLSDEGDAAAVLIPADSTAVFSDADADGVPDGYALKETAEGSGFYSIAKTWAVAFTVDGAAYTNLVVFDGEPVERPADPRKDCYTFRAWQTNGVDWVFTDAVTADLALVADWTRNAVTITAPAVANATASATTNGVAVAGTPGGNGATLFVVEAGTPVVVTYAADAGYHVYGSDPVSTTADVQVAAADTANDLTLAAGLLPTMEPNVYDVVWENWDETPLATNRVVHGTTTNWVGDTPARASTDDFGYVFASWTTNGVDVAPDAVAIVADTVFAARFDAVSLAEAKWIGGAQGDWNVATNWDIGYVPTRATVVTFTNDAEVAISNTDACKEMVLDDANIALVCDKNATKPILRFYGDGDSAVSVASGKRGSLSVNNLALFNERTDSAVSKIGCGIEILGNVTFRGVNPGNNVSASFTITGKTTISSNAIVETIDYGTTKFQGGVEVAKGVTAKIKTNPNGGAQIGTGVTLVANDGAGAPTAIWLMKKQGNSRGASLDDGAKILVDAAHDGTYYVKNAGSGALDGVRCDIYEATPKPTVVTVAATEGLTVTGVASNQHCVPGTNLVINVSDVPEGYDLSVTITKDSDSSVLLTTNAASFVYTMPDYDIDVSVTAAIQTFAVAWLDWDGTPLETDGSAEYGTVPSYDGAAPSREPTVDTTFWFDGWTNAAVANPTAAAALPRVVADATYGAHYAESNRLYAIDFRSEDGASSYFSTSLTWHAAVVYEGAEPTKPATPALGFVFAGWTNDVVSDPTAVAQLPAVSGDATYFAAFDATNNLYEVVLVADGAEFYRTNIVYDGFVVYPQRDPVHEEDGGTFLFRGWTNEVVTTPADPVGPVTEAGTWYAAFEEIDAVAKVVYADGYEEYVDTLAAAVARAGVGERAVLLADASGAGFEIDKAVTVDFGGHVYEITAEDAPVFVTAEGAVVTNGALVSSVSVALDVAGSATVADLAVTNDWEDCYDGAIYVSGAATLSGVDVLCEYGPAIVLEPDAAYEGESRLDGSNVAARAVWAPTLYALGPVSFADSTLANDDDEYEMPAVWIEEGGSARFKDVEVTANTGAAIAASGPVVLDGGSCAATNAPNWNAVAMQTAAATLAATNAAVTGTGAYPALYTIASFDLSGCAVTNLGTGAAISAAGSDAVGTIVGTEAVAFDDDSLRLDNGAFAAVEDCALWSESGSAIGVYTGAGALVTSGDEDGAIGCYESASDAAVYAEGAGCLIEIEGGRFFAPDGTNPLKALAGAEIEVSGGWFTAEVPEGCLARGYAASPAWPDAAPDPDAPYTVYIYRDIAWAVFTVEPEKFVYDGTIHAPEVTAVFTDDEGQTETLRVPGDYAMVLPEGRVNAGEYAIEIRGANSWYGTTNLVFAITNRPLSVVALDARKTYGSADPALLFTTKGLVDGDEIHGALERAAGENVGTYAITQGTLRASANYDLSFAGAVFTIDPAAVEPPAAPASAVYDGTEKIPGIATSPLWSLSGTNGLVGAGAYEVVAELADKANYTWTDGSTTDLVYRFEIVRATVEPPADPAGAVYDGEIHYAPFAESELWTVAGNDGWTAAGIHEGITVALADRDNYEWSDGTDADRAYAFTIAKATVERPAAPAGTNYVADTVYADIPASGLYAVSGNVGFRNAGAYGIGVSLLDPENYAWDDGTTNDLAFSFVVAKAPLTATARNVTVDFGDDPDTVVYPIDYDGFLGGDDETNALDPAPAVWAPGYTADAERNTSFDLVFTNLGASANYEITCDATDRKLYVAPTPVTLTFDPNGGSNVDLSAMKGLEGVTNAGVNFVVANVGTALDPALFATAREGWVFSGWDPEIPAAVPNNGTNYVAQWSAPGAMVISVADAGTGATSTNWCLSLRDAVSNAPAGSTVVLLADDRTSFAEGGIAIDKDLTIDGAGFTVYGDSAGPVQNVTSGAQGDDVEFDGVDGSNVHGFFVKSGDVTFRNLALTEFGDSDYVNKFGYTPIQTASAYTGALVLENVDIDKFNRTAVCVRGGTLTMTGGTIVANAANKDVAEGKLNFQQPIEIRGGTALIDGVTVSSTGYPYETNGGGAIVVWSSATLTNVVVDFTGVGVWTDYGSLAVVGGDTSVAATDKALFVEDGGSIAVAAGDFAGELAVDAVAGSSIVVSGGTFDRQVPAGFVDPDLLPTTVADGTGRFTVKPPRTVSFVSGEGESGLPGALTVAQTDPAAEPEQKPSKDGYVFRAWRLGGADYDWSSPVLEDIALSAAWSPAPYPLVIRYVVPAGAVQPPAYSNDVPYGAKYSVASPAVAGCTPRRKLVSGTMPMGGVEIEVGYIGSLALCSFDVEDAEYDGTPRTPGLVVRDAAGSELVAGRDYSVSVSGAPTDVGEGYPFAVTGLGSWNGTTNLAFAIVPATVEVPSLKDKVYTAAGQSAEIDGASDLYRIVAGPDGTNVAQYVATVALEDALNYRWTGGSADPTNLAWSITPAPLTVTPDALSKAYGAEDPELTYTAAGLLGDDALSGALVRAEGEELGTYAISQGTLAAGANYTMAFTEGVLFEITRATVVVTAEAATKTYGEEDPAFTATVDGLDEGGDTRLAYDVVRTEDGEDVGEYAIAPIGDAEQGNYLVTYVASTLTIEPRAATVAAGNASKVAGNADPAFTATVSGLVAGDPTNLVSYSISRAAGEAAGTYAITPAGAAAQGNYAVSFVPGTLTIEAAAASVAHDGATTHFATLGAALAAAADGDAVALEDDVAETVTIGSSVSLDLAGYTLSGDVTNAAASASVSGGAVTGDVVSDGGALEIAGGTFDGTLSGKNGGTIAIAGGSFKDDPTPFVDPATRAVVPNASTGYNDVVVRRSLAGAAVSVAADLVYDGSAQSGVTNVAVDGENLVLGRDYVVVYEANVGATNAAVATVVGTNTWTGAVPATFPIAKATLTATATNVTVAAGTDPAAVPYGVVLAGFVNGEDETALASLPVATNAAYTAATPAGEYAISVSGGEAANYAFEYVAGKLTVVDLTPPAVDVGEGLGQAGDPPAVEVKDGRFYARFRATRTDVSYVLVASENVAASESEWLAAAPVSGDPVRPNAVGDVVTLSAPIPTGDNAPAALFFKIRASR